MAELRVESRAEGLPPEFGGPTADLVYFLSFAVAERYGSTHELSGVAKALRHQAKRDLLRPLLTFAEDNPEDAEDRNDMEQIWQDAGPVAEVAKLAAEGIRSSERLLALTSSFPELVPRLEDLSQIAAWSAERGAQVRLLFRL